MAEAHDVPDQHRMHRLGNWLPEDHRVHKSWLEETVKHVDGNPKDLNPVIEQLKDIIEMDTRIKLLWNSMFEQIPNKKPYANDPAGQCQIRDHEHMLKVMNHLMTTAPSYSEKEHRVGLVGLPFHAIFDWPMGTPSGFAIFQDPQFNAVLKKVLNEWAKYLGSPDSANVLNDTSSGWLGAVGKKDLMIAANAAARTDLSFEETYECDPSEKNHGITSWDNFFTRTFREGVRPVYSPDNDDVIVNVCESVPYKVAYDVADHGKFWIKGQPYSIMDMLAYDKLGARFVGGTVYQAFLSALSYHRWHAPVSGTIVATRLIPGTYYSEPPYTSFSDSQGISKDGENSGQEYLSALSTRALIFIEADNPEIGMSV